MTGKVQTASDRLHQLENDNADLVRKFAELTTVRELVRQKEAVLRTKRASHERSRAILPTKSGDPSGHHYRTAG
jgi:hypothetical protein